MTKLSPRQARARAKREGWAHQIRNDADERAACDGCWFEQAAADRTVRFFGMLRLTTGRWAGRPLELVPWQRDQVLVPLFGWMRPDGTRRFRRCYIEIPKKSGKSTFCAGLGLFLLTCDREARALIAAAAVSRDQANVVHGEAQRMVRATPELARRLDVHKTSHAIIDPHPQRNGVFRALAAEAGPAHGHDLSGLIVDELHAWTNRTLWQTLIWGGAARTQPLTAIITTAGEYDRTSIGWEMHEQAQDIIANRVEDWTQLALVFGAEPECEITDPEAHRQANPSLGYTVQPEELMQSAREAVNRPALANAYRRYRLNIWTQALDTWLDLRLWDECGEDIDAEELAGRRCYGGLDLASVRDVTAFVLVFPPTESDPKTRVLCRFWIPEETAQTRAQADHVDYLTWARTGHLQLTHGKTTDYETVRNTILQMAGVYELVSLGCDIWQAENLAQQLEGEGLTVYRSRMSYADMSEGAKHLEALIADGLLGHGGHPVLRWMATNAVIRYDDRENCRPDKKASREKIDGIVALTLALSVSLADHEEPENVYNDPNMPM